MPVALLPLERPALPRPPTAAEILAHRRRFARRNGLTLGLCVVVAMVSGLASLLDQAWWVLVMVLALMGAFVCLARSAREDTLEALGLNDLAMLFQLFYSLPNGHLYQQAVWSERRGFVREDLRRMFAYQTALASWQQQDQVFWNRYLGALDEQIFAQYPEDAGWWRSYREADPAGEDDASKS